MTAGRDDGQRHRKRDRDAGTISDHGLLHRSHWLFLDLFSGLQAQLFQIMRFENWPVRSCRAVKPYTDTHPQWLRH